MVKLKKTCYGLNDGKLNLIIKLSVTVLYQTKSLYIYMSSSNLCTYQIMYYNCNNSDFDTWCCIEFNMSLKLTFTKYPAIHTNYSLSNCTISNNKDFNRSSDFLVIN